MLEAEIHVNKHALSILNTHFEPFAQGTDTLLRQARWVDSRIQEIMKHGKSWVFGGDLNLLPPGPNYSQLPGHQKPYYNPNTEIEPLYRKYKIIPAMEDVGGSNAAFWYTAFSNDPRVERPDRTIDYILHSNDLQLASSHVRQSDTMKISDHFPVIAEFVLST